MATADSGQFNGKFNLPVWERGVPWDDQVSVDKMERYEALGRALAVFGGPGIKVTGGPNGFIVELMNPYPQDGGSAGSFPWNLKNTTTGTAGRVQLNGGDSQVAQLNGFVCHVNGNPSDTKISGAYPQLSVTGNGYIYAYAVPTTAGTASPLASLDLYYEGTMQSQDTSNPAAYYWMLVATISNYAVDGRGNVSFDVNNVYGSGYGPSTLVYCALTGRISVY